MHDFQDLRIVLTKIFFNVNLDHLLKLLNSFINFLFKENFEWERAYNNFTRKI
jgi:hypothetical protein